jgi:hypothetical protein
MSVMNRNKLRVAVAVLATCSMAGEAWAETVCAGAQDLTALQVASLQQQLMVAALACEKDDVTLYNSFVTTYQKDLISSDEALQAWFVRRAPVSGTEDYHAFKTRMANQFSVRSATNRPGFCNSADRMFHDALAGRKQSLAAFALSQPMSMDADYTVCGDTVRGESYAYAALKEEPKEEKPVLVQPAIAAAPPPQPVLPQPPAVAQRADSTPRAYAENLQPRSYAYAPMQPQQSSCTRMRSGYLDCYYGSFHYYRDPYGRYLPPPPAYSRGY